MSEEPPRRGELPARHRDGAMVEIDAERVIHRVVEHPKDRMKLASAVLRKPVRFSEAATVSSIVMVGSCASACMKRRISPRASRG